MAYQTKRSYQQHSLLEPLLPPPGNHLKIPHRQVLDAWLYVYYQGCTWRGLPREFSNWHTIYVRLNRWAKAGMLERVVQALQQELLDQSDIDTLSLDSTSTTVRSTAAATRSSASSAVSSDSTRSTLAATNWTSFSSPPSTSCSSTTCSTQCEQTLDLSPCATGRVRSRLGRFLTLSSLVGRAGFEPATERL